MENKLSKGYLTLAIGNEFAEMAVDMALSLKEFQDEPISCIVDLKTKKYILKHYKNIFDKLIELQNIKSLGRAIKFHSTLFSPYKQTIFFDADIIILGDIDKLWQNTFNSSTLMIGEYLSQDKDRNHHGFSTSFLQKKFNTDKYLKCNSGCFYFTEESNLFFRACIEKYKILTSDHNLKKKGWIGDEIAIGLTADDFKVDVFNIYPSLMMWDDTLKDLEPNLSVYKRPICHFIAPIPKKTVNWIVIECKKRRYQNNLNAKGSEIWYRLNNKRSLNNKPPSIFKKIKHKLKSLMLKT